MRPNNEPFYFFTFEDEQIKNQRMFGLNEFDLHEGQRNRIDFNDRTHYDTPDSRQTMWEHAYDSRYINNAYTVNNMGHHNGQNTIILNQQNYYHSPDNQLTSRQFPHGTQYTHQMPPQYDAQYTHQMPPQYDAQYTHQMPPQYDAQYTHQMPPQYDAQHSHQIPQQYDYSNITTNCDQRALSNIQQTMPQQTYNEINASHLSSSRLPSMEMPMDWNQMNPSGIENEEWKNFLNDDPSFLGRMQCDETSSALAEIETDLFGGLDDFVTEMETDLFGEPDEDMFDALANSNLVPVLEDLLPDASSTLIPQQNRENALNNQKRTQSELPLDDFPRPKKKRRLSSVQLANHTPPVFTESVISTVSRISLNKKKKSKKKKPKITNICKSKKLRYVTKDNKTVAWIGFTRKEYKNPRMTARSFQQSVEDVAHNYQTAYGKSLYDYGFRLILVGNDTRYAVFECHGDRSLSKKTLKRLKNHFVSHQKFKEIPEALGLSEQEPRVVLRSRFVEDSDDEDMGVSRALKSDSISRKRLIESSEDEDVGMSMKSTSTNFWQAQRVRHVKTKMDANKLSENMKLLQSELTVRHNKIGDPEKAIRMDMLLKSLKKKYPGLQDSINQLQSHAIMLDVRMLQNLTKRIADVFQERAIRFMEKKMFKDNPGTIWSEAYQIFKRSKKSLYKNIAIDDIREIAEKYNIIENDEVLLLLDFGVVSQIPEMIVADIPFDENSLISIFATELLIQQASEILGDSNTDSQYVFAATRPPGHHAYGDDPDGFCYFDFTSHLVRLIRENTKRPIVILDLDLHHGDGTLASLETYFKNYRDQHGENPDIFMMDIFMRQIFPLNGKEHFTKRTAASFVEGYENTLEMGKQYLMANLGENLIYNEGRILAVEKVKENADTYMEKIKMLHQKYNTRHKIIFPDNHKLAPILIINQGTDTCAKDAAGDFLNLGDYRHLSPGLAPEDFGRHMALILQLFNPKAMIVTTQGGYDPETFSASNLEIIEAMNAVAKRCSIMKQKLVAEEPLSYSTDSSDIPIFELHNRSKNIKPPTFFGKRRCGNVVKHSEVVMSDEFKQDNALLFT